MALAVLDRRRSTLASAILAVEMRVLGVRKMKRHEVV